MDRHIEIFDRTNGHDDAGCEALRARLSDLRPKLHLVGHIHKAHGAYIHAWETTEPPSVQSGEIVLNDDDIQIWIIRFLSMLLIGRLGKGYDRMGWERQG